METTNQDIPSSAGKEEKKEEEEGKRGSKKNEKSDKKKGKKMGKKVSSSSKEEIDVYIVHDPDKGYYLAKDKTNADIIFKRIKEGTNWCYPLNYDLGELGLIDDQMVVEDREVNFNE